MYSVSYLSFSAELIGDIDHTMCQTQLPSVTNPQWSLTAAEFERLRNANSDEKWMLACESICRDRGGSDLSTTWLYYWFIPLLYWE